MLSLAGTDNERRKRQIQSNTTRRRSRISRENRRSSVSHRRLESSDDRFVIDDAERVLELNNVERETEGESKSRRKGGRVGGGRERRFGSEAERERFDGDTGDGLNGDGRLERNVENERSNSSREPVDRLTVRERRGESDGSYGSDATVEIVGEEDGELVESDGIV